MVWCFRNPGFNIDLLWLRISIKEPGACRISVADGAPDIGLPLRFAGNVAIAEGDSVSYVSIRSIIADDGQYWELGAVGYGSQKRELVARLNEYIRFWDSHPTWHPTVTAVPLDTSESLSSASNVINKTVMRISFSD